MIYLSSVQLGIRYRILGILCGWLPFVNIYILVKITTICRKEIKFESEKEQFTNIHIESDLGKTKYPILFVHGVFFRDMKYLNYWGRIPNYLKKHGAIIAYGNQESAASVAFCGEQLAKRIEEITCLYNVEKVNIIAHSKGGLDSRYAISNCGISSKVASLTTINTPHHGCIFANHLLKKAPKSLVKSIEKSYNVLFKKLGDENPDFLKSVWDLTDESCLQLNTQMPDSKEVYYHSVMSYTNKARGGRFPLNITYPIVKHFDGKTDGLVSVESAKYWDDFTIIDPPGNRGITHADIIDLNRENIDGFDVREFYLQLINTLKNKGF